MIIQDEVSDVMDMTLDKLTSLTDEALMISVIKLLVFKKLMNNRGFNEYFLKDTINIKPKGFFKPQRSDLKDVNSFETFINKVIDKILEEINEA